jgi:uncharacterized membrane-anchored protein
MLQAEALIVNVVLIAMLILSAVRLVMIDFYSLRRDLRRRRRHHYDRKSIQGLYVAAMKTECADLTTKLITRFLVSDLGNGNERKSWTAARCLIE